MRVNSYVFVYGGPDAEPEVGIIKQLVTPHRIAVLVRGVTITVPRRYLERMKPRQRRAYRSTRRGY